MKPGTIVTTPHGTGTVAGREVVNDNHLLPNKPAKLVPTGRIKVWMENPPFDYNPMYFWKKDIEEKK